MEREHDVLKRRLLQANADIAHGNAELARQRNIVAQVEQAGQSSGVARQVLVELEALQKLRISDRDWLAKALATSAL